MCQQDTEFESVGQALGILSEPINPAKRSLPQAWHAAIARCPYCSGMGYTVESGDLIPRDCLHCESTGDLMGTILLEAYRRGRDDTLVQIRKVENVRKGAVHSVLHQEPDMATVKAALGLR
jgi:hypothetical protein